MTDTAYEQLADRLSEAMDANARLVEENMALREGITRARLFAGDHLPAKAGLAVVHMLEKALRGGG